MNTTERMAFLRSTEILNKASEELLELVSTQMEEVVGDGDSHLFVEGDVGDAVYFVVEGELRVEKQGVFILSRREGECIGEFSLIDDAPRSADAIATGPIRLLRWERDDFKKSLNTYPLVAGGILTVLLAKLREDLELQVQAGLEYERLKHDLRRAHEIQMGMLPQSDIISDTIEISGYCKPAEDVGGDYYDYVQTSDGRYGVILGDVTDHGFYSGLFVAMAKNCFQTRTDYAPENVMQAMNRSVALSMQPGMLMTCCCVSVSPDEGILRYTNAGHDPPYLISAADRQIRQLDSTDLLLGVPGFEDRDFENARMDWATGDVLVLYSDGITEATDSHGDMFEEERLKSVLLQTHRKTAPEIKEAILGTLTAFSENSQQLDDVTLVVVRAL